MPVRTLALCLAALTLAPHLASAQVQGCGDDTDDVGGDFEVTPEDRAEHVARNAPITVRYASEVDLDALRKSVAGELEVDPPPPCAGELVCLIASERGEPPRVIEANVEASEQTIALTPREPLAAEAEHTVLVVQPGLDIVARSESSFTTGTRRDREPPVLDYDADAVRVTVSELAPECGGPEGARRVLLALPPATDDGDAESVTLEIVVVGDGQDDVRARTPNRGDPVLASFILEPAETEQRICLEVRAYDALGQRAEREPRVCFNPSTRPLFSSACAASLPARDNSWGASAWFWLLGMLAWAARRRSAAVPAKRL